jgi:hypothetical protein
VNINPPEWEGYTETAAGKDELQLTDFENLILIKSFREEKVSKFIHLHLSIPFISIIVLPLLYVSLYRLSSQVASLFQRILVGYSSRVPTQISHCFIKTWHPPSLSCLSCLLDQILWMLSWDLRRKWTTQKGTAYVFLGCFFLVYILTCFLSNFWRVQAISLGQGQGPVAEKMIKGALKSGDWVFLQVTYSCTDCSVLDSSMRLRSLWQSSEDEIL